MATYSGPERRRHQVLVTRNTEYHLRDRFCIAVRDRQTGRFRPHHRALGRKMLHGIRFTAQEGPPIFSPEGQVHVGEAINFSSGPLLLDLVTSPLEAVKRPPKWMIETYPRKPRAS